MAYTIIFKGHFDSAHYLKDYCGKCSNLHGHRFEYELNISWTDPLINGISIDFNEIKALMKSIEDKVDHKCLNNIFQFNPTAENIAKWLYDEVKAILPLQSYCKKVIIWESNDAGIEYSE